MWFFASQISKNCYQISCIQFVSEQKFKTIKYKDGNENISDKIKRSQDITGITTSVSATLKKKKDKKNFNQLLPYWCDNAITNDILYWVINNYSLLSRNSKFNWTLWHLFQNWSHILVSWQQWTVYHILDRLFTKSPLPQLVVGEEWGASHTTYWWWRKIKHVWCLNIWFYIVTSHNLFFLTFVRLLQI